MNIEDNVYAAVFSVYAQSEEFNTGKYLEIQSMILRTLESQYVDSVKLDELIHKGIDEMLSTLDPYTVFIPEENEGHKGRTQSGGHHRRH